MVLNRRLKHQNTEASRVIYLLGDQAKAVTLAMVLEEGNKEFRYWSCIALGCNQKFYSNCTVISSKVILLT